MTYKAESDGFIVAYTGGKRPPEIAIHVGEQIGKLTIRTRAGRYDGTICPVSKGDYWMVKSHSGGTVVVHWLPISNIKNNRQTDE